MTVVTPGKLLPTRRLNGPRREAEPKFERSSIKVILNNLAVSGGECQSRRRGQNSAVARSNTGRIVQHASHCGVLYSPGKYAEHAVFVKERRAHGVGGRGGRPRFRSTRDPRSKGETLGIQ